MNSYEKPSSVNLSNSLCLTSGRRARGYTLVEALVALVVCSTLLAFGVPAFASMLGGVKLTSASNGLLFNLYLARNEAVKRNARVVVCKSADGETCAQEGGWDQGQVVFHDVNNNGLREDGESLIFVAQREPGGVRVAGNGPVDHYVSYDADGRAKRTSGAFQAGTITFCLRSAEVGEARQIVLNTGGRPRMQKVMVDHCA